MTKSPLTTRPDDADRAFARYLRSGDPNAVAALFDATVESLRRVARHLVRDAATADDLIQATFLAALEGAESFDQRQPVLPWLTGILRNQARLAHRRARRRPDPRRIPEPEELDPLEHAQREELDREVDEAIAQLPEAYRPVLQLYLVHGLSAAEIATTLERPGGTVRTQIVRGLEKLRDLLPVGLAGLIAGLLPSSGIAAVRAAIVQSASRRVITTTTTWFGGMIVMKKVLGLVAAVVPLAWFVWWMTTRDVDPSGTSPDATPTAMTAEPSEEAAESEAEDATANPVRSDVEPEAAATDSGPEIVLTGRVVDEAGAFIGNAEVLAWRGAVYVTTKIDGRFDPPPHYGTTARADGTFELDVSGDELMISAELDDLECITRVALKVDARDRVDGLVLELSPTIVQEGVLLDAKGDPIAGFELGTHRGSSSSERDKMATPGAYKKRPVFLQTTTGDDGRFAVRAIASHRYLWEVQHPSHPMLRVRHKPQDGDLELRLEAGETIAGHVFRADGSPAVGALVKLNDYPVRRATCDESGAFRIVGAELRDASYLRVSDSESAIFALQPLPRNLERVLVNLERPAPLRGRVVDAGGNAVAGAKVLAVGDRRVKPGYSFGGVPTWEWSHDQEETVSGDDGTFEFPRFYEGEFELTVSHPTDAGLATDLTVRSGQAPVEVLLDSATSSRIAVHGRVTDGLTGEPLTEGTIVLWQERSEGSWTGHHHDYDGADGDFRIEGVDRERLYLSAEVAGYAEARTPMVEATDAANAIHIEVFPRRDVEVIVRDSVGRPVQGDVRVLRPDDSAVWVESGQNSRSNSADLRDGRVKLSGLPARRLRIQVRQRGVDAVHEEFLDLVEPPLDPVAITIGATPELADVMLAVFCASSDADLSIYEGKPSRKWESNVLERDDLWPIDVETKVTLKTESGTWLGEATLTPGEEVEVAEGIKMPNVTVSVSSFDRTGSTGTRPGLITGVDMRGRKQRLVVRVEAVGYTAVERTIEESEFQDGGRRPRAMLPVILVRE